MNTPDVKSITRCRVCGSEELAPIISLGSIYVSDFLTDRNVSTDGTYPLELVLCDSARGGCSLLQLRHAVDPSKMYNFYYYHSGTNVMMRNALADIARQIEKRIALKHGDLVLDIGCNDGTLLRSYQKKGLKLAGFEPAKNLIPEARQGTDHIINEYFNFESFDKNFQEQKAKIITSIAMFYDLNNPHHFVSDVIKCLHPEGLWVIQMSYLPSMLQQNAFDNICHEHLEYYSMTSLENLLKCHPLRVVDVELNDVNGGSFRIYIQHKEKKAPEAGLRRVRELLNKEKHQGLSHIETYYQFVARVNEIRQEIYHFIRKEVERGKTVYVYGASTKGNTLLQYFNLDYRLIKGAAEVNKDKFGKKTVGTLIPIVSEDEARQAKPDYFLILPWHFLKGFLQREKEYLRSGGRFIVPLPRMRIIPPLKKR